MRMCCRRHASSDTYTGRSDACACTTSTVRATSTATASIYTTRSGDRRTCATNAYSASACSSLLLGTCPQRLSLPSLYCLSRRLAVLRFRLPRAAARHFEWGEDYLRLCFRINRCWCQAFALFPSVCSSIICSMARPSYRCLAS
jgi:hypothetical protein